MPGPLLILLLGSPDIRPIYKIQYRFKLPRAVPDLQTFVDDRPESQAAVPVNGNQLSDIPQ